MAVPQEKQREIVFQMLYGLTLAEQAKMSLSIF